MMIPMWFRNLYKLLTGRRSTGFTLIELLVTTAIALVLAGGALAAYNRFNSQQGHIQAGKNVIATLERTKSRALNGDKPDECESALDAYRVGANNNSNSYQISAICGGNVVNTQQHQLPPSMVFTQGFVVNFPSLPGVVGSGDQTIAISRQGTDYIYEFIIRQTGTIEDIGLSRTGD